MSPCSVRAPTRCPATAPWARCIVTGTTTLTGQVTAQGVGGVALVVDSGGALTLAGGALLTAQQQATVGSSGQGLLILMGGALALGGPSTGTTAPNALVIGEAAGSNGTVLNLEQIAATGTVVVGAAGTGTLELLGVAASVSDGGADIGQSAGGQGSVIVNGGEWMTSGQLTVGDAGIGSLLIDGMDQRHDRTGDGLQCDDRRPGRRARGRSRSTAASCWSPMSRQPPAPWSSAPAASASW